MRDNYYEWLTDEGKIDEPLFCEWYLDRNPMICVHECFYTVDGLVTDEGRIKREIYDIISPHMNTKIAQRVDQLFKAMKIAAYSEPLPILCDRIAVANGTLFLNGRLSDHKEYCRNRLNVDYNEQAPKPVRWLRFLHDLLEPEDISTLQEFLGYCLIPSTKGQKMLMLIGKGGEGKSRIGLVMNEIFGTSMNTTSIQKVENNKFARADLEDKLLMVDDDLDFSALPKTNYIKSIVTAECRMDVERKGIQSYQSQLYVRFLCFGNGAMTALHDRSDGFFRRQIILTTKDRDPNRVDDPYLTEKLIEEKEGIFLWMIEGLIRLLGNNYQFTISDRARENISSVVRSANNIMDFLESEGYIRLKADSETSTKNLYAAYKCWCEDNAEHTLSQKSFANFLSQNAAVYNLEPVNCVRIGGGKRCRGYMGIEVLLPGIELY